MVRRVVLVLPRSATLTGFVRGLGGRPVPDAKLYLHYPGEEDVDFRHGPEPRHRALSALLRLNRGQRQRRTVRSGYTRETFYRNGYRRTYTESDGSFRFELLAPGTYTLRAPDGFQADSPPPRVPHGRVVLSDVVVEAGEVAGIELRLPPEGRISGLVVDARGNPVTDAWVGVLASALARSAACGVRRASRTGGGARRGPPGAS